ncbi:LytR family transcriptional attenuator [Haloactinospora alba]|uniref:LytR family transcriptional attenuator n=1 Tax=Haloactinospora alba TaxID=405555 RepID=A0A543NEW6_9ACTN|nr:LCP family protein [Haloactinospora alba]TQN30375.1 LytR family transcriptional attenuator [Haloactinospora alba]
MSDRPPEGPRRGAPTPEFRRIRSSPTPPGDGPPGDRSSAGPRAPFLPPPAVRRKRLLLLVASTLSVAVLLASGTAWAFSGWMSGKLNRSDVFGGLLQGDRPESGPEGALNFLVIGSDSRDGLTSEEQSELGVGGNVGQRADTMMLVHVNSDRDRVEVVALPRDSWVDIPEHGPNKINASYAFGGPSLAVRTVESATDVRIDHYVEVDFSGFVDVVDTLDGIEVCLSQPITDPKADLDMAAGTHRVGGTEALAFARTRKTAGGDFDRIDRQQQVMSALLDKAMSTDTLSDPGRFTDFLDTALSSVTVDNGLDTATINQLGNELRTVGLDDVSFTQVPVAEANYRTPEGASAVQWDTEAAGDLFSRLSEDRPIAEEDSDEEKEREKDDAADSPRPRDVRVKVFNGMGQPGLGSQVRSKLREAGFASPTKARNWKNTDVTTTLVRHAPERKDQAELVSRALPGSELVEDDTLGEGVQVVLGAEHSTVDTTAPTATPEDGNRDHGTDTARDNVCGS